MKKFFVFFFILILVCSALVIADLIPVSINGVSVHELISKAIIVQTPEEKAKSDCEHILSVMWQAVKDNDMDKFLDVFWNNDDPEVREVVENYFTLLSTNKGQISGRKKLTGIFMINENQAYGEEIYYINDAKNVDTVYNYFALRLDGNQWKIDALDANSMLAAFGKYFNELKAAYDNGRMAFVCDPLYMIVNEKYFTGSTQESVCLLYQNEDNSVDIYLQFRNGKSEPRFFSKVEIQITDLNGKQLLRHTIKDSIANPAFSTTSYTLHLDASEVKRTSWPDQIQTHMNTSY